MNISDKRDAAASLFCDVLEKQIEFFEFIAVPGSVMPLPDGDEKFNLFPLRDCKFVGEGLRALQINGRGWNPAPTTLYRDCKRYLWITQGVQLQKRCNIAAEAWQAELWAAGN